MMIALSFLVFFALVVAWLAAPSGGAEAAPAPAPVPAAPLLTAAEATA